MEIELKNCPFCGGESKVKQQKVKYGISGTIIRCATCGATICQQDKRMVHDDVDGGFKNECVENHTELAATAWNRRVGNIAAVVRCKDCGFWQKHIDDMVTGDCKMWDIVRHEVCYCSSGEEVNVPTL